MITLTFLPLSHIHFSGSIFDDQWASPATPESPHYLLLPQSNPSHVFNFLPLLCFLELILHLLWSCCYLKSTPTDTWHLPLDKDHQQDNSCNYPWLFLSSFCTHHHPLLLLTILTNLSSAAEEVSRNKITLCKSLFHQHNLLILSMN